MITDPDYVDLSVLGAQPEAWEASALCAQTEPEVFFPDKGGSTAEAKEICGMCQVRVECLDYALRTRQRFGVWGGVSERERRRMAPGAAQLHEQTPPPDDDRELWTTHRVCRELGVVIRRNNVTRFLRGHGLVPVLRGKRCLWDPDAVRALRTAA